MTVGDAGVAVDSSLTRTQSRLSTSPPSGSHGKVETNASLLSFQTASVGRSSTASAIVSPPGWKGSGGCMNGTMMLERLLL